MKKFFPLIIVTGLLITVYLFLGKPNFFGNAIPSDRLTTTSNGIQFSHPATFSGNIRKAIERPPKVTKIAKDQDTQTIGCPQLDTNKITESGKGAYGGSHFSFVIGEDLGAGQRYTSFCYIFSGEQANYVIDIEIHSPIGCGNGQCGPYCDTTFEQECKDFAWETDIYQLIEKIISTVKLIE